VTCDFHFSKLCFPNSDFVGRSPFQLLDTKKQHQIFMFLLFLSRPTLQLFLSTLFDLHHNSKINFLFMFIFGESKADGEETLSTIYITMS
jgi:hypothetical protein